MAQAPDEQTVNEGPQHDAGDDKASLKSTKTRHINGASDSEAQGLVITSLKSQVQDLYTQVTQLNNKLVKSYDRVSDLEDDLHMAASNVRQSSLRISELELERTQHLAALNTGLLVEKSQVTAELTRLMEKATEEAAQRGQAESARAAIEKDLDDLSASLFDQANTMVAEARFARFLSEQKVVTAEQALKGAEEAVAMMQQQMQVLRTEKEASEGQMKEMRVTMGKGKWADRGTGSDLVRLTRLLSTHSPYQEFLLFVAHLRSVHPASPQPPAMSTLLPLPFIARLMTEDSEPTLRLDFAPSLNWLSRRSVLAAIHGCQLTIEPMSSASVLQESQSTPSNIPSVGNSGVSCALCGVPIFPSLNSAPGSQSRLPSLSIPLAQSNGSWFKLPLNGTVTASPPPSPTPKQTTQRSASVDLEGLPPQVHIFRISGSVSASSTVPIARPMAHSRSEPSTSTYAQTPLGPQPNHPPTSSQATTSSSTIYPLCHSGWCLSRLRATCSLWAFVRSGIVEKVWDEEVPNIPAPSSKKVPPTPPRRRGLWGMASALQERAASWTESDKDKGKKEKLPSTPEKVLPATPPIHPVIAQVNAPRRMPPPLPSAKVDTPAPTNTTVAAPPPLPKRNEGRRPGRNSILVVAKPEEGAPAPPAEAPHETDTHIHEAEAEHTLFDAEFDTPPAKTVDLPKHKPVEVLTESPNPTVIPLPDSRPPTPQLPARVEAPVAGAPPPLPRRAVGRASRASMIIPAEKPAEEKVEEKEKEKEPIVEEKEEKQDNSVEETKEEKEKEEKPVVENQEPTTDTTASEAQDADFSQPSDTKEGEQVVSAATEQEAPIADTTKAEAESRVVDLTEDLKVKAKDDVVAEVEQNASSESKAAESAGAELDTELEKIKEEDKKKEDEQRAKEEEQRAKAEEAQREQAEKDKMLYIGDTTWEERTWKEIVHLKETMFWARIGSTRN